MMAGKRATFIFMKMDGIHILKEKVSLAPHTPGVYRMLNVKGDLLYVGKAKNLKKRLASYVKEEGMVNRIRKMVFETADLVIVETANEAEALLLEISLIKSLKPKYNIMFRDDTTYPYILLTAGEIPRLTSHRGAKKDKGHYYGPYPDAKAMYRTMDMLERSFLLRTCSDSEFANRSRPCLKYHIKRCSAPCVHKIEAQNYQNLVQDADDFLNGKGNNVQKSLQKKMLDASSEMAFETAAVYRDRLSTIASVLSSQSTFDAGLNDADVLGLYLHGAKACVQMYSYRNGQHVGNAQFFPREVQGLDAGEVLRLFIALHYTGKVLPKQIITSDTVADVDTLSEALSETRKVQIITPVRGEKKDITKQASDNAKKALLRQQSEQSSWKKQLEALAHILQTEKQITRIETFDISNIQGKHSVASMVVAGDVGMLKSDYRKFSIKGKDTPDDYAMMEETLTRRYGRLLKESDAALKSGHESPIWPDVIMVDGGKGHLTSLEKVMETLGLKNEQGPILLAIAKGEYRDKGLETIYLSGRAEPLKIDYNSPLKFLLQIVRDESHRFAIGYHRHKRAKSVIKSALDAIEGVGAKRKKALLLTFGSVDGIKKASIKDLQVVEGINKNIAAAIYGHFHEK
ncbi:MAG: excinuclease ABC subunit C [Alphaproteobacteria bacterium]|jgi:excinuclease ABC subunit C